MKKNIAIISDPHLTHEYHKGYDKIADFDRIVTEIMSHSPEKIIVMGDFFDKSYLDQGRPISYVDGTKYSIRVIDIIKRTKIPWFIILGNHDHPNILESFHVSADNIIFCHTALEQRPDLPKECQPIDVGFAVLWSCEVQYNTAYEIKKEALQRYAQQASQYPDSKKKILLMHLGLIPRGENIGLEKTELALIAKSFDLVINGHEHTYDPHFQKYQNVILAPALLPWWVRKGQGYIARYTSKQILESNSMTPIILGDTPFGYLLLDTELKIPEFYPVVPTMPHIEIEYDVTNKDLKTIQQEWCKIAQILKKQVIGQYTISDLILLPVLTGNLKNLLVNDINGVMRQINEPHISVFECRQGDELHSETYTVETMTKSAFKDWDGILNSIKENPEKIIEELENKDISITREDIQTIMQTMQENGSRIFAPKGALNYKTYFGNIFEELLPVFNKVLGKSWTIQEVGSIIDNVFR